MSNYAYEPTFFSDSEYEDKNINENINQNNIKKYNYIKENGDNELLMINYTNNKKFCYKLEPDDTLLTSNNLCFLDKVKKAYILEQIDSSKFSFLININNYLIEKIEKLKHLNTNFLECKSIFNYILLNIQKLNIYDSNVQFENLLRFFLEKIEKQKKLFDNIDFFNFNNIMIIDIYYLIIKYYNNPIKYIKLIESSKLFKNTNRIETYFLYGLLYSKNLNKKKLSNIKKEKALYIFKLIESIRYNNLDYIINNTIKFCCKLIDQNKNNPIFNNIFLDYLMNYDDKIIDIINNNLFIIKYCIINSNNIETNLERCMSEIKSYQDIFFDIIKKRNIDNINDIKDIKILLGLISYKFYDCEDYKDFLISKKNLLELYDKLISNLNTKENYNKMFKYISTLKYTFSYKTSPYMQYYLLSRLSTKLEKYNFLAFYSFRDEADFLNYINNTCIINEKFIKYAIICSNLKNDIILNYLINNNLIPLTETYFNLVIFKNSEKLYDYFINNKYIINKNNINFINNYKINDNNNIKENISEPNIINSFLNNKLKDLTINTEENFSELDYIIRNNLYELLNKNQNDYNITASDIINSVIKTNNTIFLKELKITHLNKELEYFKNTINVIDKCLEDYVVKEQNKCMCLFSNDKPKCSTDCYENMKTLINFIELEKIINKTNKYNYIIYILNSLISKNYNIKIVILLLTMFYNKYKLKPTLKCTNNTIQIYIDNFLN